MARDPELTASGDVWVTTFVCKSAAAHRGVDLRKMMLTLLVYSRPGWLPDCQLVLGGMLLPLSTRTSFWELGRFDHTVEIKMSTMLTDTHSIALLP